MINLTLKTYSSLEEAGLDHGKNVITILNHSSYNPIERKSIQFLIFCRLIIERYLLCTSEGQKVKHSYYFIYGLIAKHQ